MPIYVYRCETCGAVEEHIQRFSDPPKATCDTCGGPLAKQVTAAAFHLKGGGWYKDGYASSKPDGSGGGDSGGGDSGGGDAGSGSSEAASSPPGEPGPAKPASEPKTKPKSDSAVKKSPKAKKAKSG